MPCGAVATQYSPSVRMTAASGRFSSSHSTRLTSSSERPYISTIGSYPSYTSSRFPGPPRSSTVSSSYLRPSLDHESTATRLSRDRDRDRDSKDSETSTTSSSFLSRPLKNSSDLTSVLDRYPSYKLSSRHLTSSSTPVLSSSPSTRRYTSSTLTVDRTDRAEVTEEPREPLRVSVDELRRQFDANLANPAQTRASANIDNDGDDDDDEVDVESDPDQESPGSPRATSTSLFTKTSEKGGLNGLRNIGNTCFMNSVLQCLSNTKPLLEYLLQDDFMPEINSTVSSMKGALIKAFASLVQELWAPGAEDRVVNTSAFKAQVQRFAPRFMGYSQQDAQEFLRYLLEGLHEDVNRVQVKPKPITTDIDDSLSDNQKANEAWKRYMRMDDSKIMDIFVGQLKSTLQCTVCGHCSVTFDPFWDLSLPLPSRTGSLKLQACLDMFTKEEVLDGDEKPTCSKCQTRRKCTKKFSIQKFPRILVLHLKRFSPTERFRGKLSNTVEFPLTGLDLSAYGASRGQGCSYNLYAVSNHAGTTYSGHYTAYCRHPYTKAWHEYNDSRVSPLSTRSIVSGEAYVLFYELSSQTSHL